MSRVVWTDAMDTGVPLIDSQHRVLVSHINTVYDVLDNGATKVEVSRHIREFYDYTVYHFQAEESLMDKDTYPDYYSQVREHMQCSMDVLEFHKRFLEEDGFDLKEYLDYVVRWFFQHTAGLDKSLARHLQQTQGAQGDASR
jgi:hemerythrin